MPAFIEWMHRGSLPRLRVGGKGAALSDLRAAGFQVPLGFCVNAEGYRQFVASSGLATRIDGVLAGFDPGDRGAGAALASEVQTLVRQSALPDELSREITAAYEDLTAMSGLACAVRSSAISEDGAAASFAGLYESYLNVQGINDVIKAVSNCYASLWSQRALSYRSAGRGDAEAEAMAVVVMGLVPSEASGVAFTAHPVTGDLDRLVINSSWGLGEAIVSGRVTPDFFVFKKSDLSLLEQEIYSKELAIYPHPDGGGTLERELAPAQAEAPSLSQEQAREVARLARHVEEHYGSPQDIEFGLSGGQIFLLQSRPITTL